MFRWISARELSFDFLRYFPCLIHLSFYRCFADLIHLFGFVISILLFIMPFILISLIQPFFPIALHPSSFYFIHSSALFLLRCTFVPLVSFIHPSTIYSLRPTTLFLLLSIFLPFYHSTTSLLLLIVSPLFISLRNFSTLSYTLLCFHSFNHPFFIALHGFSTCFIRPPTIASNHPSRSKK